MRIGVVTAPREAPAACEAMPGRLPLRGEQPGPSEAASSAQAERPESAAVWAEPEPGLEDGAARPLTEALMEYYNG